MQSAKLRRLSTWLVLAIFLLVIVGLLALRLYVSDSVRLFVFACAIWFLCWFPPLMHRVLLAANNSRTDNQLSQ